jgi:HEAT repeat protein
VKNGELQFSFLHRSILEYLNACALNAAAEKEGWAAIKALIDKKSWHSAWRKTIMFLAGRLTDPFTLLNLLGDADRDDLHRHQLCLAAYCLTEVSAEEQQRLLPGVRAMNNQQLLSSDRSIPNELLHLWWVDSEHNIEFSHIKSCLPTIAQIGRETILPELLQSLRNPSERENAVKVLQRIGEAASQPEIIEALLKLSHDQDAQVCCSAVKVLGHLGAATPEVLNRLLELLYDLDLWRAASAAEALGRLGIATPEVLNRLLELSHKTSDKFQVSLTQALGYLGIATPELLNRLLESLHMTYNEQTLATRLGVTPEVLTRLLELSYSPADLQVSVTEALGRLGAATPEVLTRLLELSYSPNIVVRGSAAEALGRLGVATPEVLTRLLELLHETNADWQASAAEALSRLGIATPEVLNRLLELSHRENGDLQISVLEALGRLGVATPEVLNRLLELSLHSFQSHLAAGMLSRLGVATPEVLTRLSGTETYPGSHNLHSIVAVLSLGQFMRYGVRFFKTLDGKIEWKTVTELSQ